MDTYDEALTPEVALRRAEIRIRQLELQITILKRGECLCPDCRDKMKGQGCPRCALQAAETEIKRLNGKLDDLDTHYRRALNGRPA